MIFFIHCKPEQHCTNYEQNPIDSLNTFMDEKRSEEVVPMIRRQWVAFTMSAANVKRRNAQDIPPGMVMLQAADEGNSII